MTASATLDDSVPSTIGSLELPKALTAEWCRSPGPEGAGRAASRCSRSFDGPNVVLVSLGAERHRRRLSPRRCGVRRVQRVTASLAFFLPTEGIDDPAWTRPGARPRAHCSRPTAYKSPERRDGDLRRRANRHAAADRRGARRGDRGRSRAAQLVAEGVNWAKFLVDSPAGYHAAEGARQRDRRNV